MGNYKATRDYASNSNGRYLAFSEGDQAEIDDSVAEWVNRDSPGTLVEADVQDDDQDLDGPPSPSASKAVWVDYATRQGLVDAESFTKQQLIDNAPDYLVEDADPVEADVQDDDQDLDGGDD